MTALPFNAEQFARAMCVSAQQVEDLQSFYHLLEDWGSRMNLVGPTALAEFWPRHVFDSAQLLHVEQSALRWADVGSGAGFPGIVLAILLKGRKGVCIHLIESMAKRARFLEHVVLQLELPAQVHHGRGEAVVAPAGLEVVTARACAPLPKLLGLTHHFFRAGARGLFLKGQDVMAEMAAAQAGWTFSYDLIQSLSDDSGRLVHIHRLERRG